MKLRLVTLLAAVTLSSLTLAPAMAATYTTAKPAAGAMTAKPATGKMMSKATPDPKRFTTVAAAQAYCPTDTIVWANTRSKIYHLDHTATFGKGKNGTYMCTTDAKAEGFVAPKKPEKLISTAK